LGLKWLIPKSGFQALRSIAEYWILALFSGEKVRNKKGVPLMGDAWIVLRRLLVFSGLVGPVKVSERTGKPG
jgi:hypothetical protein